MLIARRAFLEEVLRLSIEVIPALDLLTPVALDSPIEVVVLALRAHPAPVGEVECPLISLISALSHHGLTVLNRVTANQMRCPSLILLTITSTSRRETLFH